MTKIAIIKDSTSSTSIPIVTEGECFEAVLEGIAEVARKEGATQVRKTAVEVVQECANTYAKVFGVGDVGENGTGLVSVPFKPSEGAPIAPCTNGLLYGRVQSGKTNISIATVALARENGFRCFVVLTSDNIWLGMQTARRFRDQLSFGGPKVVSWEDWKQDPKDFGKKLRDYVTDADSGVVFVSTKNRSHLENLLDVLSAAGSKRVPTIVLDDEADNASLNTRQAQQAKDPNVDPSTIFELIGKIRAAIPNHIFLQVTATPQSLLLQGLPHPSRPSFSKLSEPGGGYIGGRVFFEEGSKHVVAVDPQELDDLRTGKINPGDSWHVPKGLRLAVCCFLLGAASKQLASGKLRSDVYSMLVHIDHRRVNHDTVAETLANFLTELDQVLREKRSDSQEKKVLRWLEKAYAEIQKTESALQPLDELVDVLKKRLRNTAPQVINADNPRSEPEYRPGLNVLVGGNRLGRGVTIEGLMVTYYGRDAKVKMMDTVHQHARMFGYREKLLSVTRLFSAEHILDAFRAIYESDEGTREAVVDADGHALDVKPVWVGPSLQPTRANVLNPANIGAIVGGKQLWPRFLRTKKADIASSFTEIESRLAKYADDEYHPVSITKILELMALMPSDYVPEYQWEDERVAEVLRRLEGKIIDIHEGLLHISRGKGGRGHHINSQTQLRSGFIPGQQQQEVKSSKKPVLILRKQEGLKTDGWHGQPFYAPTLFLPQVGFVFMFTYD